MPITRTQHESVAVLAIDMGRGNAIHHPFIDALGAALDDCLHHAGPAICAFRVEAPMPLAPSSATCLRGCSCPICSGGTLNRLTDLAAASR